MSEIALVAPPHLVAGAALAGLKVAAAEDAASAEKRIAACAAGGASIIIVTGDLVQEREAALRKLVAGFGSATALLVLPADGGTGHLAGLRRRFAAAVGVDVWETAARRGSSG